LKLIDFGILQGGDKRVLREQMDARLALWAAAQIVVFVGCREFEA
jgi:hypothetical protein